MIEESKGASSGPLSGKGAARLSDIAGRRMLPIGNSDFVTLVRTSVFVDKSMLISDILGSGSSVLLYCRPRRFGKSLNLSMLQAFFESPSPSDPASSDTEPLFRGLRIWEADGGRFRSYHAVYPVIRFSFNDVKDSSWPMAFEAIQLKIASECGRHDYLAESPRLSEADKAMFRKLWLGEASESEAKSSLLMLTSFLFKHHGTRAVVLIDEYDAPVMAGYTFGYYDKVVGFLKGWLTGALKDNSSLAFAVLTGVQRISKESIFSDLNNMTVNTSLSTASDERYGFTQDEIDALAAYLGKADGVDLARQWYDGYRFGSVDVYNPWSALNYFNAGCVADVYWGNTSGNSVLGDAVRCADADTLDDLYRLLEPGGAIREPLDLSVVFPDVGVRPGALWSMLYLAGYVTTSDTDLPNSSRLMRSLRIPNREIRELFRAEVVERFGEIVGGRRRLDLLQRALVNADEETVGAEMERILLESASFFDLATENSYHMLMLGLLVGMTGYADPVSNREAGRGRFDIRVQPDRPDCDPVLLIEIKRADQGASEDELRSLAGEALRQTEERSYLSGSDLGGAGAVRWGLAFSGKRLAAACS